MHTSVQRSADDNSLNPQREVAIKRLETICGLFLFVGWSPSVLAHTMHRFDVRRGIPSSDLHVVLRANVCVFLILMAPLLTASRHYISSGRVFRDWVATKALYVIQIFHNIGQTYCQAHPTSAEVILSRLAFCTVPLLFLDAPATCTNLYTDYIFNITVNVFQLDVNYELKI